MPKPWRSNSSPTKCISGAKATLILYKDTLCAAIDPITWTNNSSCVAYSPSTAVPAVMFACDVHAGDQPQPTLTSTVAAGSTTALVPPATSPSQDSSGIPTSFTSAGLVASATPGSSAPPTSSQTGSSSASGQSDSNVSRNGQIALGVVLPLGAIAVAVLAWCYPKPWNQGKEGGKSGEQRQFHELGV